MSKKNKLRILFLAIVLIIMAIFSSKTSDFANPKTSKIVSSPQNKINHQHNKKKTSIQPDPQTEEKNFDSYLVETLKTLPQKKDLRGLIDQDVHHQPEIISKAGDRLAEIKKRIKANKKFNQQAIAFYQSCALQANGVTTIRSLCVANLIHLKKEQGQEIDPSKYPKRVLELADEISDLPF